MPRPSEPRPVRVMLICAHAQMRAQFQEALGACEELAVICHTLAEYPAPPTLARVLRLYAPEAVALSFEVGDLAAGVIRLLEREVRGLPVVGIHTTGESSVLIQALHAGARDFLTMPFSREATVGALQGVRRMLSETPLAYTNTEHIYSFLPSKPGAGSTTLAMNVSAAVARRGDTRVLLADLDLACGMIRFLLKLPPGSIMDAITRSADMDLELWRQTVFQRDGVDVLHSGGLDPQAHLDPRQVQGMIDFARQNYKFMCFDMSGNLEQYSLQVMYESKEVFVICTPDRASLELAREKVDCLASAGLKARASILLNRHGPDLAIQTAQAEEIAGVPVRAAFADSYKQVQRATMSATWLEPDSRFGKEIEMFSRILMGDALPPLPAAPLALPSLEAIVPRLVRFS